MTEKQRETKPMFFLCIPTPNRIYTEKREQYNSQIKCICREIQLYCLTIFIIVSDLIRFIMCSAFSIVPIICAFFSIFQLFEQCFSQSVVFLSIFAVLFVFFFISSYFWLLHSIFFRYLNASVQKNVCVFQL